MIEIKKLFHLTLTLLEQKSEFIPKSVVLRLMNLRENIIAQMLRVQWSRGKGSNFKTVKFSRCILSILSSVSRLQNHLEKKPENNISLR